MNINKVEKEIKYSYKMKEFRIVIIMAIVLIGYILIANNSPQWTPDDKSNFSVATIIIILWFNDLAKWIIWKLAGGWKE